MMPGVQSPRRILRAASAALRNPTDSGRSCFLSPIKAEARPMSTEPLEALLELVPHVRVLDHRPGSLKLRFLLGALTARGGTDLTALAREVPGILRTRVNLLSRTLSIDYDPDRIGYDVWESILSLAKQPENRPLVLKRLGEVVAGGDERA